MIEFDRNVFGYAWWLLLNIDTSKRFKYLPISNDLRIGCKVKCKSNRFNGSAMYWNDLKYWRYNTFI